VTTASAAALSPAITAEQVGTLAAAEDVLTGRCMIQHGFNYWNSAYVVPPAASAFPYVLDDPAWAAKFGYNSGFAASVAHARSTDANARYVATLSPQRQSDYLVALNGGGPDDPGVSLALPDGSGGIGHGATGCSVTAETRLYGDFSTWFTASRLVNFYQPEIQRAVLADPQYRAGVTAWSTCMAGKGTPFASPAAAHAEFAADAKPNTDKPNTDKPNAAQQAAEVAVASAEVGCAASTGLAVIAHTVEARHISGLGSRGLWAFATERQLQTRALTMLPMVLG